MLRDFCGSRARLLFYLFMYGTAFPLAIQCLSGGDEHPSENATSRPALDVVRDHVSLTTKMKPAENVFPGPPSHVVLGYPDCDYDYRCYCQNSFSYRLQRVDVARASELRKQVSELEQLPMFGCYETGRDLRGKSQHRCRFVRKVQLARDDNAFKEISLPNSIGPTVTTWIESVVRVDRELLPIEETAPGSMPILAESDEATYEVIEGFSPHREDCDMEVSSTGKVFDFFSCRQDLKCIGRSLETFRSAIRSELSTDPFNATEIHDQPIPPGEMWMRHKYKASAILGPPYFELATYVFKFWFAGTDRGPSSTEPNGSMHSLYLNVVESITCQAGIGGERYSEPRPEQLAAYKSAIDAAVARALSKACRDVRGQVKESLCHY
jgi:hypothetical protein